MPAGWEVRVTQSRKVVLVVALVGAALYLTTLGNGFVMDDGYNVVRNEEIRSLADVPGLFFRTVGAGSADAYERQINQSYWRPLAATSFAVDYAIWGLRPLGFHLTNVLLYGALCALVAFAVLRLTRSPVAALVGGLWYAVHPVHAEAVNLVTYRTEILAALAVAGALALLAADGGRRRARTLVLVALVYVAGLLSKESAATLPGWLFLAQLATNRDRPLMQRPWWALYGVLAAVLVGWFVARAALIEPMEVRFFGDLEPALLFLSVMKIYGLYVRLLLFPWPMTPFYDWTILAPAASLADPEALAGLAALLVTIALAVSLRRRAPLVALGLGCWLVGLLPFAQLVPLPVGAAERFLLIPTIGVALIVGEAARSLWGHSQRRRTLAVAGAVLAVGYSAMVLARNPDWQSDLRLQEATVTSYPESFNAHHVLGQLYQDAGRIDDAVDALATAEHILPGFPPNSTLLARALVRAGRPDEALAVIDAALARAGQVPELIAVRAEVARALPPAAR